jgi:hypothetical protein
MTSNLDNILNTLKADGTQPLQADFSSSVWSRIGELQERRSAYKSNALAGVMFVVAVGAGFGTAQQPVSAQTGFSTLTDGPDYSPAGLLNISQ